MDDVGHPSQDVDESDPASKLESRILHYPPYEMRESTGVPAIVGHQHRIVEAHGSHQNHLERCRVRDSEI